MHILCWTVLTICQRTAEQQLLHMSVFLRVIYAILNASVILERNETHLVRNEKRLARNETRGGNLPLSGTVDNLHNYSLHMGMMGITWSYKCCMTVVESATGNWLMFAL